MQTLPRPGHDLDLLLRAAGRHLDAVEHHLEAKRLLTAALRLTAALADGSWAADPETLDGLRQLIAAGLDRVDAAGFCLDPRALEAA